MTGRVFKRDTTWRYTVDLPKLEDGKRRQRVRGGFATKREAEAALSITLQEVREGRLVDADRQTTGGYLHRWLEGVSPGLRPSTCENYGYAIRWAEPHIGHVPLQDLTPQRLQRTYNELGRSLGPRSIRLVHTVLRCALAQAESWALISRNPADAKLTLPRKAPQDAHTASWTQEEARTFISGTAGDRLGPLWVVMLNTGLRRGEVLGLRWADVDMAGRTLQPRTTLVVVDGKVTISEPKTPASRRVIPLNDAAIAALLARAESERAERLAAGTAWQDLDLVFATALGGTMHPSNLRRPFESAQRRIGVPRLKPHGLRHTFASLAGERGVHPKVVQEILGHADSRVTMDVYTHTVESQHREAVAGIGLGLSASGAT